MTSEPEAFELLESTYPRVLVADDDELIRTALAGMLVEHGFAVVGGVGSGPEAIEMARSRRPDVALVDYRMPGMDGVELTALLKQDAPFLQVVMLTAYDDQMLSLDAARSGVFSFLVKGCDPALIMDALERAWAYGRELIHGREPANGDLAHGA